MKTLYEQKVEFKKLFFAFVGTLAVGDKLTDTAVLDTVTEHNLALSLTDVQACIRDLEAEIGQQYQRKLQRMRGEGYVVLDAVGYVSAVRNEEGGRIVRAAKRLGQRLEPIAVESLPTEDRQSFAATKMTASAIAAIGSVCVRAKRLSGAVAKQLSTAVTDLKMLEVLKKTEE